MRRLILYFFPFFIAGIILYNYMNFILIGAAAAALFLIMYIRKNMYMGIFLLLFLFIGLGASYLHTKEFNNKYTALLNSKTFEGYVIDKDSDSYVVKNYKLNYKIVLYSYKKFNIVPGDYITFDGTVYERPEYKKEIMNSKGINAYIKNKSENIVIKKNNNILLLPVKIKYKLNTALIGIDKEGGSFISGLITGYTKEMTDETKADFKDLGISHILAVSGFNVGIIFYFMVLITNRLNAKSRYLLTLLVCFIYTTMGGFEPSIFRAFLMISIIITSKLLNRFYDIVSGITLSAYIMLLINSFYIFNIGFLLSYAATYGIILLNKDIEDKLPERFNKIKSEIAVSLAAFLSTLPLILWYMGYFSLISLLINVIISPFVAFATIFSFLSGFLYSIINLKIILYPSVLIGVLFIKFINFIANFNIILYPGKPSNFFIVTYYLFIGVYFGYIKIKVYKIHKRVLYIFIILLMFMSLLIHDSYLKIHFINVGQGDSLFIETPDRKTILIDTGPATESYSALKERVLPYIKRAGYNKIDLLIITHFHNDHCGDYQYLLDNYVVKKILVFKKPDNEPYNFTEVTRGDEIKIKDVYINILYPTGKIENIDDKNETCLVMELDYKGFSMLLTADAEKNVMDTLTGSYDVFKVPHHGSIKSFSTSMVDNSSIGVAVISVGKNNFGHPSKLVLDYLSKLNIKTYRTDINGNITIVTHGENYKTLFQ
jgi:competence protein ComEC